MWRKLIPFNKWIFKQVGLYKRVIFDQRTPFIAKVCYGLIIAYAVLPFDIVSDFIPVIGQIDDLILIPMLFIIAKLLTPKQVLEDCRHDVEKAMEK